MSSRTARSKRIKDRDRDGKVITPQASVQPFSVGAEAEALGVERSRTRQDDLKAHAATGSTWYGM
jgi:hypothetical protein